MARIAQNSSFGPPEVVKVQEAPIPELKNDELLIRVHASTVSTADARLRSRNVPRGFGIIMGLLFGFKKPKYKALGTEAAGEVVRLGKSITQFQIGDRVVANLGMRLGGHAEHVVVSEKSAITKIPHSIPYTDAAALVFGGTTALIFLRDKLKLKNGERILIIGAGGVVGSAAVQLAQQMGAQVTGVCSSQKVTVVQELGAHSVMDYTKTSWREKASQFDLILDTVGVLNLNEDLSYLPQKVRVGLVVADLMTNLKAVVFSLFGNRKYLAGAISETKQDLDELLALYEKKKFKPLIGQVLPLEKIVEAHRIVDSGHKLGSVVIDLVKK